MGYGMFSITYRGLRRSYRTSGFPQPRVEKPVHAVFTRQPLAPGAGFVAKGLAIIYLTHPS